jgi:hypothetical protein
LPPPYPVLATLLLFLEVRLIRCELFMLSLVEPDLLRRMLRPRSILELTGRRLEWGTLSRAEAGLWSLPVPRDGSLRLFALNGRKV